MSRLTVMIIPENTGKVKKYTLPRIYIHLAKYVFVLLCVGITSLSYLHVKDNTAIQQVADITQENKLLKEHIHIFHQKLEQLQEDNNQIYLMSYQVQKEHALTNEGDQDLKSAVGGGENLPGIETLLKSQQIQTSPLETNISMNYLPFDFYLKKIAFDLQDAERYQSLLKQNLGDLISAIKEERTIDQSTPSLIPAEGWLSSRFGYRISPFTKRLQIHKGLDIAGLKGTPVLASASGVVVFAGQYGGYGLSVKIDHSLRGEDIATRYAHLSKITVKSGQFVEKGQKIGEMGNSGRSTDTHLHFEVLVDGVQRNPARYVLPFQNENDKRAPSL